MQVRAAAGAVPVQERPTPQAVEFAAEKTSTKIHNAVAHLDGETQVKIIAAIEETLKVLVPACAFLPPPLDGAAGHLAAARLIMQRLLPRLLLLRHRRYRLVCRHHATPLQCLDISTYRLYHTPAAASTGFVVRFCDVALTCGSNSLAR